MQNERLDYEPIIYLKKNKYTSIKTDKYLEALNYYYETIDQYISRIPKEKTILTDEEFDNHLQQLMDIAFTCRFIYRFLDLGSCRFRMAFSKSESFINEFNLTNWYFCEFESVDLLERNDKLLESISKTYEESFRYIWLNFRRFKIFRIIRKISKLNVPIAEYDNQYLNFLLNSCIYVNLGLFSMDEKKIEHKLFPDEFKNTMYSFIGEELWQIDKDKNEMVKTSETKIFMREVSEFCIKKYLEIWEAYNSKLKRMSKSKIAAKKTKEELIKTIYEKYDKLPNHFFEILKTVPFEGEMLLNENYDIKKNFESLVITEIDKCRKEKNVCDWPTIRALFNFNNTNMNSYRRVYKKRLEEFEKFLEAESMKYR